MHIKGCCEGRTFDGSSLVELREDLGAILPVASVADPWLGNISGASIAKVDGTKAGALWKYERRPRVCRPSPFFGCTIVMGFATTELSRLLDVEPIAECDKDAVDGLLGRGCFNVLGVGTEDGC